MPSMFLILVVIIAVSIVFIVKKSQGADNLNEKPKKERKSVDSGARKSEMRGAYGEREIALILSKLGGTLYNDYMMADEKGMSHQIDHILVLSSGVFVIETKNYSGRIYGDNEARAWTQVLDYGKIKNSFYNPVKQNATHLFALKEILPKGTVFHTCVVFVQDNIEHIKSDRVFTRKGLTDFIKSKPASPKMESKIQKINEILEEKYSSNITKKQHVENINAMQKETMENKKCPRCGGALVLRKSASGSFYGCENYPKCRFTKNI